MSRLNFSVIPCCEAKAYRKIGVITGGIPNYGFDIGTMYLNVFPSVPRSCKIGIKLQAVNPGGYHSSKLFVVGLTPLLTLTDFGITADDDFELAMGQ